MTRIGFYLWLGWNGRRRSSDQIEVGAGGTAGVVGGTGSTLYLWLQKNLVWGHNGTGNTLDFGLLTGEAAGAPNALLLNLATGQGTNP